MYYAICGTHVKAFNKTLRGARCSYERAKIRLAEYEIWPLFNIILTEIPSVPM